VENSLKQRIIGAVVLIALAIIFLPAILKDKDHSGTFESKIPAQPEELANYRVDIKKIDELVANQKTKAKQSVNQQDTTDKPIKIETETPSEQVNQSLDSPKVTERKTKQIDNLDIKDSRANNKHTAVVKLKPTKISEKYQDAAWVIQVASFSKLTNAKKMVSRLKQNNYKAYRRKVVSGNVGVIRVFVGPYIEKKDAQKALALVSKLSESDAILKPFDPIKH